MRLSNLNRIAVEMIYYGLIIFVIGLGVYLFIFTRSEGRLCGKNPFIYGAIKMGNVNCECTQDTSEGIKFFNFNGSGFYSKRNDNEIIQLETINYSAWLNPS